ncbi:MAG: hypothetical protein PVF91_05520 [Chromatiales bacterium]
MQFQYLKPSAPLQPSEPLWRRVPSRDERGRALTDFMMLIPRLRHWPQRRIEAVYREIQTVFEHYAESVVFADLNLDLNVLWVSVRPRPGICLELAAAVKHRVPEAVLVASQAEAYAGLRQRRPGR